MALNDGIGSFKSGLTELLVPENLLQAKFITIGRIVCKKYIILLKNHQTAVRIRQSQI